MNNPNSIPAPPWRRFAAILYDGLIVIALLMFATALTLPLTGGEAVQSGNLWMQIYLLIVATGFFVFFWKRAGQTLGMRVWKIRLVHQKPDQEVHIWQLILRAISAIVSWLAAGLGFLWCFIDTDKSALHDHLSKTRLVLVDAL